MSDVQQEVELDLDDVEEQSLEVEQKTKFPKKLSKMQLERLIWAIKILLKNPKNLKQSQVKNLKQKKLKKQTKRLKKG